MIVLNPIELALFSMNIYGAMQKLPEFAALIDLVNSGEPRVILEIGVGNGGSLAAWSKIDTVEKIIAVDLPEGPWGNGKGPDPQILRQINENSDALITFIAGNSQNSECLAEVLAALEGEKVDFLMIDGDHSYGGVKTDFLTYSPLVRPGGLIALHDICKHGTETGCEVEKFWVELKETLPTERYVEFIGEPTTWGGISAIKMEDGDGDQRCAVEAAGED